MAKQIAHNIPNGHTFDQKLKELNDLLEQGYKVVHVTPMPPSSTTYGQFIYILEKPYKVKD